MNDALATYRLMELRLWKEAIQDLEIIGPMFPERTELHALLAKAYQETGQPELAFRHRRLATQNDPSEPEPPNPPPTPDRDPKKPSNANEVDPE